jgi:hypothetical protein
MHGAGTLKLNATFVGAPAYGLKQNYDYLHDASDGNEVSWFADKAANFPRDSSVGFCLKY